MKPPFEIAWNHGAIDFEEIFSTFVRYGTILLRDIEKKQSVFESLTDLFCTSFVPSPTRKPLHQKSKHCPTTLIDKSGHLFGHSEGAYRPIDIPDIGFFMCLEPPIVAGGETTLINGAEMLHCLPDWLCQRLISYGVIYECHWEADRWQKEFSVKTPAELHTLLHQHRNCQFNMCDELLHLRYSANAIISTRDGPGFINGTLAHLPAINHPRYPNGSVYVKSSNRVYFGDGEEFTDPTINTLIDAHDQVLYRHRWQAGDVLIVDNLRHMHGRYATEKPCKRILISRFGCLKSELKARVLPSFRD